MKDPLVSPAHLLTTFAKILRFGGVKTIVVDSLLMKQYLLVINRFPRRTPNSAVVE